MLVITRNKGETFRINDDISITVANTDEGRCKLIINAPKRIKVLREEVAQRDALEAKIDSRHG